MDDELNKHVDQNETRVKNSSGFYSLIKCNVVAFGSS